MITYILVLCLFFLHFLGIGFGDPTSPRFHRISRIIQRIKSFHAKSIYISHSVSDKAIKGTVVNWTYDFINVTSLKITLTDLYRSILLTVQKTSDFYYLNLDSLTEIWGSKERHIDKGSPFNLTCRVSSYQQSIPYILWYHNDQVNIPLFVFDPNKI